MLGRFQLIKGGCELASATTIIVIDSSSSQWMDCAHFASLIIWWKSPWMNFSSELQVVMAWRMASTLQHESVLPSAIHIHSICDSYSIVKKCLFGSPSASPVDQAFTNQKHEILNLIFQFVSKIRKGKCSKQNKRIWMTCNDEFIKNQNACRTKLEQKAPFSFSPMVSMFPLGLNFGIVASKGIHKQFQKKSIRIAFDQHATRTVKANIVRA